MLQRMVQHDGGAGARHDVGLALGGVTMMPGIMRFFAGSSEAD